MPSILSRPSPVGETGPEDGPGILIAAVASTGVWVPDGVAAIDGAATRRGTAADALAPSGTVAVDAVVVHMPVGMVVAAAAGTLTTVAADVMAAAGITADSASVRPPAGSKCRGCFGRRR